MKTRSRRILGNRTVVFFDLEGTQFSHEMIALGAISCKLNAKGEIVKMYKPFKVYSRAKNKIGSLVVNLTGITEKDLKEKGVQFSTAMKSFKAYVGRHFKDCLFVSFGNNDVHILNQSVSYNLDAPMDIVKEITRRYLDFLPVISEYVKDDKNNPYSLVNYCKLFKVKESGTAHDPAVDAINLANLYNAFIKNENLVFEEYKKVLQKVRNMPEPIYKVINKLAKGEDVPASEFDKSVLDYIKK